MAQSAMRTNSWEGKWEPFSSKWDEWFFLDEFDDKEVNDPLLKLPKHEIAEQVLHEIEDLGKDNTNDWLDEFPLFEEIKTSAENFEIEGEQKIGIEDLKNKPEQFSTEDDDRVTSKIHQQLFAGNDLFSVSNENAATFVLSDEKVIYINNEPFLALIPSRAGHATSERNVERTTTSRESENKCSGNVDVQPEFSRTYLETPDMKMEMAIVDEIIRNTALELDQWESDTSRSETSWDGMSASDMSPKEKEEGADDPEWKPDGSEPVGKQWARRAKPYCRGGSQEERKLRKKEQNKNAATRYRQKKKAEVNEILKEEESLKEKKAELEGKMTDIQNEIKYLKALMRDLFKAKGVIN